MLMESGMGCCCPKEDTLFWKNLHIDAMNQLVHVRQENLELRKQLAGAKAQCENTVENRQKISELSQTVINLREEVKRRKDCGKKLGDAYTKLIEENAELQKKLDAAEKESDDLLAMYDKVQAEAHQAKVAKDRIGYSNSYMQSKIAKQSNEIKRLTEENKGLRRTCGGVSLEYADLAKQFKTSKEENKQLHNALDIAAKDANANFERGEYRGMNELWTALAEAYGTPEEELRSLYGYTWLGGILDNLTPTWFMDKYNKKKGKEARDIKLGDEVEIFDSHDPSLSDIGIVIAIDKDNPCFAVIGPKFEGCFDETDIDAGNVKKTGRHFDTIPLDYFA